MTQDRRELSPRDLEEQAAVDLPPREALTLIGTLPHLPTTLPETGDGGTLLGTTDTSGAPTDATGATDVATDAAASESGTSSVTDEPRSEHFSSSDSAVSTT